MRNDFCSNYLEHSAKGKEWANHKYVAKIKLSSGKWFYFYDTKTYQNYLKRTGGEPKADSGRYAKKDPTNGLKVTSKGLSYSSSMSTASKLSKTSSYIAAGKKAASSVSVGHGNAQRLAEAGKKKASEILSKAKSSSTSSKKSSGSSSKKSSGTKTGKSSGSSSSKSGSSKKAAGSSKAAKATKEKTAKEKTTSAKTSKVKEVQEQQIRAFDSAAAMRQMYGVRKDEVSTYDSKDKMLEEMKTYDDGAFGYLTAKNTTYSWEKKDGEIHLIDLNTGEEVSIDEYLKDVKSIEAFRTDNKQKKSKYRK